jgi:beta-xylosidase
MLQQVGNDGVSLIGEPEEMITNDAVDEGGVEAPTMLYGAGRGVYFLIYSSGCYTSSTYTVRVATATSLTGPWTKSTSSFLVTGQTDAQVYIPGGVDVTADGSKIVFHGDLNLGWFVGDGPRIRGMFAAQVITSGFSVVVGSLL